MKMHILIIAAFVLVVFCSIFATASVCRRVIYSAEFKLCESGILFLEYRGSLGDGEDPTLREYLKARYYYLSTFLSGRFLKKNGHDFGPVDKIFLKVSTAELGPPTPNEDYQVFLSKLHKGK